MKILKWIFIIIVILVIAFLGFNAAQDSKMTLDESIEINAPASAVFAEIVDFEAWDAWSAWSKMDPDMEQVYEGEKGTVGYKNSWKSENQNVGVGSQEVVEIRANEYMRCKMRFEGFDTDNFASFTLSEEDGKTTVVWDFEGGETPFMMRFINALIEPAIRESYKKSLSALKAVVESKPVEVPNPLNLEVVAMEEISIISIRDTTTVTEISNALRDAYAELSVYLATQEGVEMSGMPMGIYHHFSDEMVDLEAAFAVSGEATSEGNIVARTIPAGEALKGIHMGDYNSSIATHTAINEYAKANTAIDLAGHCIEIYANDPMTVDSAEVKTEIYYPLK